MPGTAIAAAEPPSTPRHLTPARYLAVTAASCFVCFAVVWLWIAAAPLAYLDPEYPAWRAKRVLLDRCELGSVLLLGDSRAAVDVIPALLPVPVSNLAVGGGSPVEALAALRRALNCPRKPGRVVLSFDAAHFTQADLFWERSVRFGFLDAADLAELRVMGRAIGDATFAAPKRPDGLAEALRARLYAWRFPPLYFASLVRAGGFLRAWRNQATFTSTLAARGQYFFGRDNGSSIVAAEGAMTEFHPLPVLDRYFDHLLATLAASGIPVDFVAMPINQATGAAVRPSVRAGFAAYLRHYAARYPGFHVVGTAMPTWPDHWFGDGFSHLNPPGAALLTAQFATCLQARLAGTDGTDACRLTTLD